MRMIRVASIGCTAFLAVAAGSLTARQEAPALDEEISVASHEDISYPPVARLARIGGVVVVEVVLDDRGTVAGARALSGHQLLRPAAVNNVQRWRFAPGTQKRAFVVYRFEVDKHQSCWGEQTLSRVIHPNFVVVSSCFAFYR